MGMRLSLSMVAADEPPRFAEDAAALLRLLTQSDEGGVLLHMDKEWHGIHFLLTGEPWPSGHPLGMAVFGAEDVGDNLGYGPARALTVDQVHYIANELSQISAEALRQRYDAQLMMKEMIYPEVWQREGQEALEWLVSGFQRLVTFYSAASSQQKAVILAIL
jgi:hypothetical protein